MAEKEYDKLIATLHQHDETEKVKTLPVTSDLRESIAAKHNLPSEMANRLRGEDEEAIVKDAEYLSKYIRSTKKGPVAPLKSTEPIFENPNTQSMRELVRQLTEQ